MSLSALVPRPPAAVARLTGSPLGWAVDLGLVGALTAIATPAAAGGASPAFLALSGLGGALCGSLLGSHMPDFLDSARHRISLRNLAVRCTLVGAGVGGLVALVAAQITGQPFVGPLVVAMLAGALQLGLLWLPYTVLTVTGRSPWPVVVLACAAAPLVGASAVTISELLWVAALP